MNTELKKQIVEAAKTYADSNKLGQEAVAELTGVNISYINALWQGNFTLKNNKNKGVAIKESYFRKIARAIGFDYEPVYWETVDTDQFLEIQTELLDAKNSGRMKMLIGETGCGKTYTINKFLIDCPMYTYRITVSSLHNIDDIISDLCGLLGINPTGSRVGRMKKIAARLKKIKLDGGKPVLIIDEAENLRLPALKMLKGLYDALKDYCAIVLIGTSQLSHKLDSLSEHNIEGMPQFCRRFKAGKRNLPRIDKDTDFAPFLERVDDNGLRIRLTTLCDNYGELNDYLETAMREADKAGCELTEDFFMSVFNI